MLLKRISKVWKNYLVGQFLVTVYVFLATWGAGALTGLEYALPNAIAAGICESIPNFGPIVSAVISGVLALVFGSSRIDVPNWQFLIITIICVLVIQALQNWLISPLIIGKKMDLHPLIVFIGMIVFSSLFGIWGMILAVPIIGTIKEIYRWYNENKNNSEQNDRLERP